MSACRRDFRVFSSDGVFDNHNQRLSPILTGEQFEIAIEQTEGFSFAQLRETYILGAQSAFEHGKEITVADVIEAIELQAAGAQDLKTSISASGFVSNAERPALR